MENVSNVVKPAEQKDKLWNLNFFLLWQGQFVSFLGDAVYELALGFWVLAVTGSTALMGTLMAVSIIPKVLISPFAGAIVDRVDRKRLLVLMDIFRGAAVVFIGIAAYRGFISIGLVVAAEIIAGICGAFFSPAINSAVPDIVPPSKLMSANSAFGILQSITSIFGNSIGGIVFSIFGAPLLFLFNGLSFLVSGFFEVFLKVPKIERTVEKPHLMQDMKQGYQLVWEFKGLRSMLILLAVSQFILSTATVLLLPLFQKTESLGPEKYGIFMAFFTGGMLLGMVITSVVDIPPAKRLVVFLASGALACVSFMAITLTQVFPLMVALMFVGGLFASIPQVLPYSAIQLAIPQDMRGKVFALAGMFVQGLMPLGMALGGVLGEFIAVRTIIFACFLVQLLIYVPYAFMPSFKEFINFDPGKENLTA